MLWLFTCMNGPPAQVRRVLHTTLLSTHVPLVMLCTLDCSESDPKNHRFSSFGNSSTHCKPRDEFFALRCFRDEHHG